MVLVSGLVRCWRPYSRRRILSDPYLVPQVMRTCSWGRSFLAISLGVLVELALLELGDLVELAPELGGLVELALVELGGLVELAPELGDLVELEPELRGFVKLALVVLGGLVELAPELGYLVELAPELSWGTCLNWHP